MTNPKNEALAEFAQGFWSMAKEEDRIHRMTDAELVKEWNTCEPESLTQDLLADELERREIDL